MSQVQLSITVDASQLIAGINSAQTIIELEMGDTIARMPAADYRRMFGIRKPHNLTIAIARVLRSQEH
jgi:hypothetical protein